MHQPFVRLGEVEGGWSLTQDDAMNKSSAPKQRPFLNRASMRKEMRRVLALSSNHSITTSLVAWKMPFIATTLIDSAAQMTKCPKRKRLEENDRRRERGHTASTTHHFALHHSHSFHRLSANRGDGPPFFVSCAVMEARSPIKRQP